MTDEIWIIGATGRSGQTIAAQLAQRNRQAVLVGRDAGRLEAAAQQTGGQLLVSPSIVATAEKIRQQRPRVVINTVGPFHGNSPAHHRRLSRHWQPLHRPGE